MPPLDDHTPLPAALARDVLPHPCARSAPRQYQQGYRPMRKAYSATVPVSVPEGAATTRD
eukprot:2468414-Rhodomonas_salina.3